MQSQTSSRKEAPQWLVRSLSIDSGEVSNVQGVSYRQPASFAI